MFQMLLHCGCDYQLMFSLDGVGWEKQGKQQSLGWCRCVVPVLKCQ